MQLCKLCKQWKDESAFTDEKHGVHGDRKWCRDCAYEYVFKKRYDQRELERKLTKFWNENHKNSPIPMPLPLKRGVRESKTR
jgi:hypothetical protein